MLDEATTHSLVIGKDDRRNDGPDIPTQIGTDMAGEAGLGVQGPEQLLHVHESGLDFDHEQGAGGGVPGEQVDPAALAISAVADLDTDDPPPSLQATFDGGADRGVTGIEQPIELRAVPHHPYIDAGTECHEQLLDDADHEEARMPALQQRDGSPADSGPRGKARLCQPLTDPEGPSQPAEPLCVHSQDRARWALTTPLPAAYRGLGDNGGMPEGDTIYRTAEVLRAALGGRRITAARAQPGPGLRRVPDLSVLVGAVVERVDARGKHLLIGFSNGLTVRTHLRMTGSWHRYRRGEPWRRPQRQASAILETAQSVAVAFNTPVVELLTDAALRRSKPLGELGPDLLGREFDEAEALHRLRERERVELGNVLLDQRAVAGIGNVYKSEVAFLERLDPWAQVSLFDDDELVGALRTARRLLRANTRGGARATTGSSARGEGLWVYGRAGQPCRRCATVIRQGRQGELARLTYWCPRCQVARTDVAPPLGQLR